MPFNTGANEDLAAAGNNFATNGVALDTAKGAFDTENSRHKDEANISADNARRNINTDASKGRQSAFRNLAADYTAEGEYGTGSELRKSSQRTRPRDRPRNRSEREHSLFWGRLYGTYALVLS